MFLGFVLETKFSVLHNCYRYLYQYRRQCWELWADTTDRSAAASPPATDCLSNVPAPDTTQGATWQQHQLYARSAPPAFLQQKKVWATKWLLAWQEPLFKIEKRNLVCIYLFMMQQSVPSDNISSLLKKMRTVPGVIWPDFIWFLNHQAIATKTVWPR